MEACALRTCSKFSFSYLPFHFHQSLSTSWKTPPADLVISGLFVLEQRAQAGWSQFQTPHKIAHAFRYLPSSTFQLQLDFYDEQDLIASSTVV